MEIDDTMKELHERWEAEEAAKKQALLNKIELTKNRVAAKDKAIEELKYERDLIFGHLCRIISEELRFSSFNLFMGFNCDMFWKAWKWCHHKDEVKKDFEKGELKKDEYKQYKTCFDMTVHSIQENFFGDLKDQVKFKEIIMCWSVGYDYTYTYKDQEITIFIPNFSADEKTLEYALAGYRVNYKESDICSSYICGGLDYKEVAKKLQEWILAEGWKKGV